LIGPELVSIKFQLESIIRVRKKNEMWPFPSSFSCLNPTTLLFSLFSFGVQHVDMKLGTSLSHHLVGEGLSKSRQNPTSKLPKL
jgi:hypothetical protein